jgi:alcohol dehydrogenase class IV
MLNFTYEQLPTRVVFGIGAFDRLAAEVERLGAHRALVLATPEQREQAEAAAERLGARSVGIYAEAVMHVPIETARKARAEAARLGADCAVAVGGGSTTGLGKAIALESGLPIIAVPTTYAGSEMTPIYGLTEGGVKRTGRDRKVLPRTVIYDPLLTLSLPVRIAAPSGMNALAHCVEALYAEDANPVISLMAEAGMRALARALPIIAREPDRLDARSDALYGAWLAGLCLGSVAMALHHKLCHTLGGSFNLPHAEVHTVILPQAAAFNRSAAPEAMHRVAEALGAADAAQGLYDLAARIGAPLALKDIGMAHDGIERAAQLATQSPYPNPRPVELAGIRDLLENAYHGRRPAAAAPTQK